MDRIEDLVRQHEEWRGRCINLIPSENATSPAVRAALASDLGNRYSYHVGAELHGQVIENAYRGTRWADAVEARAEALAKEAYGAAAATVRPISGHVAGLTAVAALVPHGGRVLALRADDGGYDGYHLPHLPDLLGYVADPLPWDERHFCVDAEATGTAQHPVGVDIEPPQIVDAGLADLVVGHLGYGERLHAPLRQSRRHIGLPAGIAGHEPFRLDKSLVRASVQAEEQFAESHNPR